MKIDIVWKSYHKPDTINRGYWDQSIVEDLLNRFDVQHHNDFFDNEPDEEGKKRGAVVVINARSHVDDVPKINADISDLQWCLLILTGDEEAQFPWQEIQHPMLRVWAQLPRMNVHNDVSQKLPNGPRPATRELLKDNKAEMRDLDWSFVGQVNHDRRKQCVAEAKLLPYNGFLQVTDGFAKEALSHIEYVRVLTRSKVVLCPSGIETPDTFRLYEALEAGCLPIVDSFSDRHQHPGFWQFLFGEDPPFPIVDYWDKLPALMPSLLRDWPHNASRASAWWQVKKRNLYYKLKDDIEEIAECKI